MQGGKCDYVFTGSELQDPFLNLTPSEVTALTTPTIAPVKTNESELEFEAKVAAFEASVVHCPADVPPPVPVPGSEGQLLSDDKLKVPVHNDKA